MYTRQQYTSQQFASTVLDDFERRRTVRASGSYDLAKREAALETKSVGHPNFDRLAIGQQGQADLACVFLDLTDFTGRSFWDDAGEVADLAHAILTGFIEVVDRFGGHPLGLRGDGLFAGFGPHPEPAIAGTMALGACAFALQAVQGEVNARLKWRGIEPVQARAGADYGDIRFVRTGSAVSNDINQIGFAANFAAKCEKVANSWEVVIGEGLADLIDDDLVTEHVKSPKVYQRNYHRETYRFYDYHWRRLLPYLSTAAAELNGRRVSAIGLR